MERLIKVEDYNCIRDIFGVEDCNLRFLEKEFKVRISQVNEGILIIGSKNNLEHANYCISKMIELTKDGFAFDQEQLRQYISTNDSNKKLLDSGSGKISDKKSGIRVLSGRKKFVMPKTKGQLNYIKAILKCDITFSIGPAGTGKTYLAMAMAVNSLVEKRVRRIILTRPAIEAGESLGFLPGGLRDKLGPYLRPLYDALYDMLEADAIENYINSGIIEIAPLAHMRGRTLNNAFIILDEAQNCTPDQLKMFLTRLGFESKTVITGDITQSDLPEGKPAGLLEAVSLLKPIKGINFIYLDKKDAVRHPLIQEIIQAYEDHYCKIKA
ncbi:MAG: PhoH family protein [Candidatus Omnitrophota bacterium]